MLCTKLAPHVSVSALIRTLTVTTVVVFLATAPAGAQITATTTRPISDFVSSQGTFCLPTVVFGLPSPPACLTLPPFTFTVLPAAYQSAPQNTSPGIPYFIGWTQKLPTEPCASVDYAGVENGFLQDFYNVSLGTTTDGTITERPLANGAAEVTVLLHTQNALTWVVEGSPVGCDFVNVSNKLLFGHAAADIASAQDASLASLADSFLKVVFTNNAPGAPLPDMVQLFFAPQPGQQLLFVSFYAQASGSLRAPFGVADGTPGRAQVAQTGLIFPFTKANPNSRVGLDAFPAEHVELMVVGK
jgi:hypothetical protein